ncbi:MAG: sugar ABC transporter substrate-binding protein [Oscillospiraceae bacterium]|jgi:putative aldouronate transport system substrate-binding protein|nr:sugar ABC transporter substrate-binding protein [Oscillospiraceae bacterium]
MKKALSLLLAGLMLLAMLAACSPEDEPLPDIASPSAGGGDAGPQPSPSPDNTQEVEDDSELDGVRFKETRHITVEMYRRDAALTETDNNVYTQYIAEKLLETHNIVVDEYMLVGRFDEEATLVNWLAGGDAPDICLTYNRGAVTEYEDMGGLVDLEPFIHGYQSLLPHMWDVIGEYGMYNRRKATGEIYAIESVRKEAELTNTFVREDWLKALSIKEPNTRQEFEDMLVAFRDNADTLLGEDAASMIPMMMSRDVGWQAQNMMMSFVPSNMTDRDRYVYGFDDRQVLWPGIKDAIKLLNKWYNDGLLWKAFSEYPITDPTGTDLMKAGYVGSYIGNWDYVFRQDIGIQTELNKIGANFVPVDPFENDAGKKFKRLYGVGGDRCIIFPDTNKEPLASLFYLDMLCRPEILEFVQLGKEGVNYDIVDGAPIPIAYEEGTPGYDAWVPYSLNSTKNIDMTPLINGYYPAGLTQLARASSPDFAGVESRLIAKAVACAQNDAYASPEVSGLTIAAEAGLAEVLKEKRDNLFNLAVNAAPADFDSVWDNGMNDYLASGGQAIIDERAEKYDAAYGG